MSLLAFYRFHCFYLIRSFVRILSTKLAQVFGSQNGGKGPLIEIQQAVVLVLSYNELVSCIYAICDIS